MINGIINVYKERGFTSFDVVAKLRGILHERKIGHTGTLDPEATGVLPVCIGNATKVCELLTDKDKVYRTVMHLGITTDTQDMTGTVKEDRSREAALLKEQTVEAAILQFVGDYEQIPPMYSALKVNGKKLCDLARAGILERVEDGRDRVFYHTRLIELLESENYSFSPLPASIDPFVPLYQKGTPGRTKREPLPTREDALPKFSVTGD